MPVVFHTLVRPGGAAMANEIIRIRLLAAATGEGEGFIATQQKAVLSESKVLTDSTGKWTVTLVANALIVPANTTYEVVQPGITGGRVTETFIVPNTAGPFWLGDILAPAPVGLPQYGLDVHDASTSAHSGKFIPYVQGADPTGVLDSSLAIRDARDAAGVNGTVVLKPGTYRLRDRSIQPLAGQTWIMWGATIVADPYISASETGIINNVDRGHIEVFVPDVTLLGGTLDGRRQTYPIGQLFGLLLLGGSHRARVVGMTVKNMPTHSSGLTYGDGIHLGARGAHTAQSNDTIIEQCIVQDNGRQNIAITGKTERVTISGCHFRGASTGIDFENNSGQITEDMTVTGCTFLNHSASGVNISVGSNAGGFMIVGNTFEQATTGISAIFIGVPDCVIANNRINGVGLTGGGAAIEGYSAISDITIIGNTVRNSGIRGIQTAGRGCVIIGNTVINSVGRGISVIGTSTASNLAEGTVVSGNRLLNCGSQVAGSEHALDLNSIKDVVCVGNNIRDTRTSPANVSYGIRNATATADFATSTVLGNRITGFAIAAIITPNVSNANTEVWGDLPLRFKNAVQLDGTTQTGLLGVNGLTNVSHAMLVTPVSGRAARLNGGVGIGEDAPTTSGLRVNADTTLRGTVTATTQSYETSTIGTGLIAKSPDGTRYKLVPANGGGAATWVPA